VRGRSVLAGAPVAHRVAEVDDERALTACGRLVYAWEVGDASDAVPCACTRARHRG